MPPEEMRRVIIQTCQPLTVQIPATCLKVLGQRLEDASLNPAVQPMHLQRDGDPPSREHSRRPHRALELPLHADAALLQGGGATPEPTAHGFVR